MTFEHFALIWPILGTSLAVAVVLLVTWLQDRAERHKAR
jgi:hypothetical protein